MNHRIALLAGALLGLTGVAVGAFGAHALRPFLLQNGMLEVWQTGVEYQLVHAVALVALASWMKASAANKSTRYVNGAAWCWIAGAMLFSGSLYRLAAGAPHWVGPITPLGGLSLLVGWFLLIVAALVRSP